MSDEQPTSSKQEAKADAKADKARAKAMRPWFKKKRFIIPIAIVVLAGISRGLNGADTSDSGASGSGTASDSTSSSEVEKKAPGIGDQVVDGKFTFQVNSYKCGISHVGSDMLGKDAQGQFCAISLSVANTGDEAQTMFGDNQTLYDAKGRKFSADTAAMIYLPEKDSPWMTEINPGNSIAGVLLFDVPKDVTLDHIELHDSAFSGGVEVSLK